MQNPLGVVLVFILYGLHQGAIQPVQKTFISELSPKRIRTSLMGTFQMVVGLCALPASVIAGFLWQSYGSNFTFGFSLILSIIAAGLMAFVREA